MELLRRHAHLLAAEVLDAETDAAEFDRIKLFNFVVEFALGVL